MCMYYAAKHHQYSQATIISARPMLTSCMQRRFWHVTSCHTTVLAVTGSVRFSLADLWHEVAMQSRQASLNSEIAKPPTSSVEVFCMHKTHTHSLHRCQQWQLPTYTHLFWTHTVNTKTESTSSSISCLRSCTMT